MEKVRSYTEHRNTDRGVWRETVDESKKNFAPPPISSVIIPKDRSCRGAVVTKRMGESFLSTLRSRSTERMNLILLR